MKTHNDGRDSIVSKWQGSVQTEAKVGGREVRRQRVTTENDKRDSCV